jgi:hypothetical protein
MDGDIAMHELHFRIEQWDVGYAHIERTIAAADNLIVARAAFDAAARQYPRLHLTLRDRARVIGWHPETSMRWRSASK